MKKYQLSVEIKGVKKVCSAIKGIISFGSVLSIFLKLSTVVVMNKRYMIKPVTPLFRYSLALL